MGKWKEMRDAEKKAVEQPEDDEYTMEDLEREIQEPLSETMAGFRARAEREAQRAKDATDSNYYFVVWFSTPAQLFEFCDSFNLSKSEIYMDGREVARAFRRALKSPDFDAPNTQAHNKDYIARARDYTPKQ